MFKLNHFSNALIEKYNSGLAEEKIQLTRVLALVTAVMYLGSIPMDFWALPSVQVEVLFIRFFIVAVLISCFVSTLYKKFFLKHYTVIVVSMFLLVCCAVMITIHLAKATELAYTVYFAVLVVSLLNFYSWTYLSTKVLFISTVAILGGYTLAVVTRTEHGPHGAVALLSVTLSILLSAAVLGYLGMLIRDKNLYEKFCLQDSLEDLVEIKKLEAKAHEYHASHDYLTKLPNRRFLEKDLSTQLGELQQEDKLLVLLFLDLNGFKEINDVYGHSAGDEVLKVIAKRLTKCINSDDSLVRLGGDEFLISITLNNDQNYHTVLSEIIGKIKASVKEDIAIEGTTVNVSTSIGISKSGQDGYDINHLITVADNRMYEEKRGSALS